MAAAYRKERSLEGTPTWAVAVVCFVLVLISIFIGHLIHLVGHWLKKKNKPALYEALEKIKAELMLLGFISLLLVVVGDPISQICVSETVGNSWHPCSELDTVRVERGYKTDYCTKQMRRWRRWEDETKTIEYQYSHDPERFRFARDTSFGRRHLNFWSQSPILLWTVCFFRQFFRSVTKVDYLTLRHGFIAAHLAPGTETKFDFQKYIRRSLEEDFKVVVGISPLIWFFAVLFLMTNTNGWYAYLWLPFIPLIIILLVSTKLQVIITKMGVRIAERGDVVKGTPVVQPGDDLFWFNNPRFMLFLIHFCLFLNAFQLAFFVWSWYEFGLISCYHQKAEDVAIRISMGVLIEVICSYVTLPLYAIVTQMGSSMKPTIFNDRVASALKHWHKTAKKHTKHPESTTPTAVMSPVHLLHNFRQIESNHASPMRTNLEIDDRWDSETPSPPRNYHGNMHFPQSSGGMELVDSSAVATLPAIRTQHEINIGQAADNFSFEKRTE